MLTGPSSGLTEPSRLFPDAEQHGVCLAWSSGDRKGCPFSLRLSHLDREPVLGAPPIWTRQVEGTNDEYAIYRQPQGLYLRINSQGHGLLHYAQNRVRVFWEADGTPARHYLAGIGLAMALESRGVPCLHANVLQIEKRTIALLAPSQGGKSSLSLALLERGHRLLCDDMMALHGRGAQVRIFPSSPRIRLWPDAAAASTLFAQQAGQPVHAGYSKREYELSRSAGTPPYPLDAVYFLQRGTLDGALVDCAALSPAAALLRLLAESMLADAYRPLGLEAARLGRLAGIVSRVPAYRLQIKAGLRHLPAVASWLERHESQPISP